MKFVLPFLVFKLFSRLSEPSAVLGLYDHVTSLRLALRRPGTILGAVEKALQGVYDNFGFFAVASNGRQHDSVYNVPASLYPPLEDSRTNAPYNWVRRIVCLAI